MAMPIRRAVAARVLPVPYRWRACNSCGDSSGGSSLLMLTSSAVRARHPLWTVRIGVGELGGVVVLDEVARGTGAHGGAHVPPVPLHRKHENLGTGGA